MSPNVDSAILEEFQVKALQITYPENGKMKNIGNPVMTVNTRQLGILYARSGKSISPMG